MACLPPTMLLVFAFASPEQDEPPRKEGAMVVTRHGEAIVGPVRLEEVAVRTSYGLLRVPVAEVARVEFAPAPTAEDEQKVEAALAEAGRLDAKASAEVIRDLASMGPVARRILAARPIDEKARPLVDQVLEKVGEGPAGRDVWEDVVVAKRFTVVGRVELESLEVGLAYGALQLSRGDIERIAFSGAGPAGATNRVLIVRTWTDEDEEYAHVREFLAQRSRLHFVEFAGHDGKDLARALRGHRILLVPELEEGRNAVDGVASEAGPALRKFVKDGGVVVSCGGDVNVRFLSQSGLLACGAAGTGGQAEVRKRHPIVQGVQGAIPEANATYPILVEGAKKMQALAVSGNGGIVVGVARVGAGAVIYCGWDYYQSQDPQQRVLANALRWAAAGMPGN